MNFVNDFITYNKIFYDAKSEASAESEVLLPDYYPPIMKLVRTEAVPFVRSQTTYGEKVVIEGSTEFRVVYLSEAGGVCSFFTKVPFSCTAEIKEMEESYPISISPSVEYFDVRALSPQKMHVKATVCVGVRILCPEMMPVLVVNDEPGVAELKTMASSYCKNVCCGRKSMKLSDELDLGTRPSADEILNYYVSFTETENKLLKNKVVVKGEMGLKIVYYCNEKKTVEVFEQRIPVSQIVDIDNIDEDTICNVSFDLADCTVESRENDEGKRQTVVYDMEVAVTITGYHVYEATLVEDAFGVQKEIDCVRKPFFAEKALVQDESVAFNEVVDIGACSKVDDLNITPKIGKVYYDKDTRSAVVSGLFNVSVMMEDEDGELACVVKNVPFTMNTDLERPCRSVRGELAMSVSSCAFVPVDSTKIEVRINCAVKGCLFITEEAQALCEINILEDKESKADCNLVLYFAQKGEKIWDIAKRYSTSPGCLMKDNEITEEVLSEAKTLLISI